MLYDITMRGLTHLSLNTGNKSLPTVVENLCNMRRRHQRLFHKLAQLRETVEQETSRLNSAHPVNNAHPLNGATNGNKNQTNTST